MHSFKSSFFLTAPSSFLAEVSTPPLASTHYSSWLVLELGAGFVDDERAIVVELFEQLEEGDFVGVETWECVFSSNVFDQKMC